MSNSAEFNPLSQFKDIHKGKRAIVCGAGPSLDDFDFNKITKNDIVFACNRAVTTMKHCGYFCFTDNIPATSYWNHGCNITENVMFLSSGFGKYENIENKSFYLNRNYNNLTLDFYDDKLLIHECSGGLDCVHVTSNLAHIMGCCPIVLVGVDLRYRGNQRYCTPKEFKDEITTTAPIDGGPPIQVGDSDKWLDASFHVWEKIKTQNPNIIFLTVSENSRLSEIFPICNPFVDYECREYDYYRANKLAQDVSA